MTSPNARIANLSQEKQALLAKLLQQKTVAPDTRIAKRTTQSPCPLSFAQERLWFLAQMDADSPFYNIAGVVQLHGTLNSLVLEQALNEVIRRHEALRTAFLMTERPQQYIVEHSPVSLLTVDLADLNEALQQTTVADITHREAHRVFDLKQTPLLRATLLKLGQHQYTLLMTLHHIVSDEWSLNIFIKELSEFYQSFIQGNPSNKPELSLQYADFACWQRQYLQGERQQKQLAYWAARLADVPQLLELPTDRPRPVEMSYRGETHYFELAAPLSDSLRTLARNTDSTLFMLSMAIFAVLLQRHAGQTDICIGYPVANRNRREIESLIGFFVNTQVLRSDLSGNPRFIDLLSQIRQHVLDAQNHQDIPFEQLVDELKPERSLNHTPLFQVMLAFQNGAVPTLNLPDLTLDIDEAEINSAKFDLTLTIINDEKGLHGNFNYSSDLFNESYIVRLTEHFQILTQGIVQQPNARLSELPLLTVLEQQQLAAWNTATAIDYALPSGIHQLFEQQVEKTPNAIALVFENQSLDYATLNQKANQVAHYLLSLGVRADDRVAICMERSIEMIIAALGILKAGGAYLPLDPNHPKERLAYMLDDAMPVALLTQSHLQNHLPDNAIPRLCLDAEQDVLTEQLSINPNIALQANHLAYIIYTSGSTGQAKGVMIEHKSVANMLMDIQSRYQLCDTDRCLQFASLAFDASVEEIFGALISGAALVLRSDAWLTGAREFWALCETNGLTVVYLSTLFWQQLTQDELIVIPSTVRNIIIGGEAVSNYALASWFKRETHRPILFNTYGPTETTVNATTHIPTAESLSWQSIGHPTTNTHIYILDSHLHLVPIGVSGEMYIGGAGVARGYLNRDELTAERFIQHAEYGRIYKTGDLGRWLVDGTIEYLGRNDFQVKIRGFRIELGEIEAALLSHVDIKEAVVLAREDGGRKQLVAYLVAQKTVSIADLQAHLKQHLPDYMLPGAFVYLAAFPLTANGKLNRKALPAPNISEAFKNQYVAPQTAIEKMLADIWCELLGLKQVGSHDNFFDLGGDSILSIQVVSRARQAGIIFTPKQLFQHQSISALALVANQETIIPAEQGLVSGHIPLTPVQHWFFEQGFVNPDHWNQALLFEITDDCSPQKLEQALQQLLNHHDALRLQFSYSQDTWQQVNLPTVDYQLLVHCDLSNIEPAQQAAALELEASKQQAQLHLAQGQLVRVVWFDLGKQQKPKLLIAIHHLAVDGVSWRILLEDLMTLLSGQTQLSSKTTSFKQWAEQITSQIRAGTLTLNAGYWLSPHYKETAALAIDNKAGLNTVATEQAVSFSLSENDTCALLTEVHSAYQTKIDDLLLTALAQTLCAWSQQSSVLIDLEGHGREEIVAGLDVSRTVGWFTSVFPVVLGLPNHGNALPFIKEQLRAIPDKGIAYGWLRYTDSDIAQQLAALPKASVIFNYLGQFDAVGYTMRSLSPVTGSVGQLCDTQAIRDHEFDIVCHIADGQLQIIWRYSGERYTQATIAALMSDYERQLKALITHCLLPESGAYTPSDFPLAALTQAELDALDLIHGQVEDLYPLAPLQQGLLFHSLYAPESGVYCVQMGCQLKGDLNVEVFKQAWQEILNRHSILRTHFHVENWSKPLQQVDKQAVATFNLENWSELTEQEQSTRWQQLLSNDAKTPFDFKHAPLMRLGLVQCSERHYYFFWSHHHVLLDGWSNSLIKEVFVYYEALKNGSAVQLPTIRPYRDYIAWLQNQDLAAAKNYWQKTLAGFTAPTSLGVASESKTHVGQKDAYARHALIFSAEQTQNLQAFVKQQQLTLNTLVQGVWSLLLSRYSGEQDVIFGTTVSGRPAELSGVEFMIGLFINSLPVRVQIAPEISVVAWLKTLFEQNLELRRYEYTPLVDIQGWSDVPRGTALFDSLLVFENYPIDAALTGANAGSVQHAGLVIENIATVDYTSYPLTVSAFPGDQFKLEITYDCQRFDEIAIAWMLGHLQQLITAIVQQPDSRLCDLSLLTAAEYQQLIVANNATTMDLSAHNGIHQLFEQQVTETPDAIALVFGKQSLSYDALNQRANQVAHYLLTLGIRPDDSVAVCMERSVEMIVAVLGILKAGGAYLPLDPSYPADRLSYMLDDALPVALLTIESTNLALYAKSTTIPQLMLDTDSAILAQQPTSNPVVSVLPQHLAYIIYTSGSTGQPKGVMIEHCNALNFIEWAKQAFPLPVLANTLFATSLNFDLAVYELFAPLSVGATVHLVQDLLAVNASLDRLTLINTVPSAMNALINSQQLPATVHNVNLAGEPLKPALAERIFANSSVNTIANLYGPTETTTYSTWTTITKGQPFPAHIGRPIANTQIYILDAYLQPVPQGVSGEIYIGGRGVARGYLNRPDLTAERFLQDPFTQGRMYKTGDLGRWLADGNIEYMGRNDFQVKIRGFRIELGEIEARLHACQGVREAVVIAREDNPDDKRLVAYLLAHDDCELSATVLRTQLATVLADYMIPSAFIMLPEFPLTPNGKLNRKALPAPDFCEAQQQYVAPRTPTEQTLAQLWSEVLNVEQIGIQDNFFALGGHSLIATQLISRVCKTFAIELPLKVLFETATIAQLAEQVDLALWANTQIQTEYAENMEFEDIDL